MISEWSRAPESALTQLARAVTEPQPPEPSDDRRQAHRYDIAAPVQFRARGGAWLDGATVNMSRLGLLIRTFTETPVESTPLRLRVLLQVGQARTTTTYVAARGRVVRTEPGPDRRQQLMAVTLDWCRLRSSPEVPRHESGREASPNERGGETTHRSTSNDGPAIGRHTHRRVADAAAPQR